jgi:hypothetical protein
MGSNASRKHRVPSMVAGLRNPAGVYMELMN